ncbi:hypothetical protein GCM10009556_101670 [Acrocarpospora pleiomorpha]
MADLDFFADLMIRGTVLGLDHTSKLVDVEKVLGCDRAVEVPSGVVSDFGLVEFGWWRDRPEDEWGSPTSEPRPTGCYGLPMRIRSRPPLWTATVGSGPAWTLVNCTLPCRQDQQPAYHPPPASLRRL